MLEFKKANNFSNANANANDYC